MKHESIYNLPSNVDKYWHDATVVTVFNAGLGLFKFINMTILRRFRPLYIQKSTKKRTNVKSLSDTLFFKITVDMKQLQLVLYACMILYLIILRFLKELYFGTKLFILNFKDIY